ncbi:MAG TPA: nitrate reductase associated protein [Candidatus Binataceae bacterium]|nr:nitrate reductase associated protein [Candidatus Binataceae bacterium]
MIRKFKFEDEIYRSLDCLPMAARRKLDALGIKLHRAQWEKLGRGERLMICHAPVATEDERDALRVFIEEAALARTGSAPKSLPDSARATANPPARPPETLTRNARAENVELSDAVWSRLDDDQRYALIKLGATNEPSTKFPKALREFLSR